MANVIVSVIIIAAVTLAVFYLWKEKKNGRKCIGCPMSDCSSCNCHSGEKN